MAQGDFVSAKYDNAASTSIGTMVAGDTIVVMVCTSTTAPVVTDTRANSYGLKQDRAGANGRIRFYVASGVLAGTTSVLVSGAGTRDYVAIILSGNMVFDQKAGVNGAASVADSGATPVLSNAIETCVGLICANATQPTAGTGWTRDANAFGVNNVFVSGLYQKVTATTAIHCTSASTHVVWDADVITLQAAGGGGGGGGASFGIIPRLTLLKVG